jgi:hypothetical protein
MTPVRNFQVLFGLVGSQSCTGLSVMFSSSMNSTSPGGGVVVDFADDDRSDHRPAVVGEGVGLINWVKSVPPVLLM